ncbi:MAG: hypothetical protein ACQETO_07100 [Pseudomonadota bacterium]
MSMISAWLILALFAPSAAQAYLLDPADCTPGSLTITRMEDSPIDGNGVVYDGEIAATQCFGVNTAGAPTNNDDALGRSSPSPNIGHLGDGFLNGEPLPDDADSALDPYLFIDSPAGDDSPSLSTPHDVPGNDSIYDPGWIHLAGVDHTSGNVTYSTAGTGGLALDIEDLLEVDWSCISADDCGSGTWSVETAPDIVEQVQELLGPNAFDHLAISVFQANRLAVYDFDFTILSQPGNELAGLIDFVTPYSFTGAWNMQDFSPNSGSFSHVNFWARDPLVTVQTVPTPISWTLILAGLLGLGMMRRQQLVGHAGLMERAGTGGRT